MSSFNYLGAGEALVVREKCNSLKQFTTKTTFTTTDNNAFFVINYENSIIGKQVLSGLFDTVSTLGIFASTTNLNFRFTLFEAFGIFFLVTQITGQYNKCNYSSGDLQVFDSQSVASKEATNHFKPFAKSADEFAKLLKSNASLNKMYLKLKAK